MIDSPCRARANPSSLFDLKIILLHEVRSRPTYRNAITHSYLGYRGYSTRLAHASVVGVQRGDHAYSSLSLGPPPYSCTLTRHAPGGAAAGRPRLLPRRRRLQQHPAALPVELDGRRRCRLLQPRPVRPTHAGESNGGTFDIRSIKSLRSMPPSVQVPQGYSVRIYMM
jgi:hypothetical protein